MNATRDSTWIGEAPEGVVVVRVRGDQVLVDRPARGSFGQAGSAVVDGAPVVEGVVLRRVAPLPARMTELAGWYDGAGRRVLLTQVPEDYFGEPMVLVAEGERVVRAHALGDDQLLTEDGASLALTPDGMRLTTHGKRHVLARSQRIRERELTFDCNGVVLGATVLLPPGRGPHPAAVLLHGAAGGQRDFCRLHAEPVLRAGVAVLIYDKAGHGRSGGTEPTIFDQADAAEAAVRAIATVPEVDAGRIGLAGFSNGMWAAPMVAARGRVAFLAGIGAPGVSMAESEIHRRTKVLRDAGVTSPTLAAVGEAWRCIFTVVGEGPSGPLIARLERALATIAAAAEDLGRYEVPDYVRQNPMLSPVPPSTEVADLLAMLDGVRDPEVGYDPVIDYRRLTCPVFLQYGADDTSVPVAESVARIEAAVPQHGAGCEIRVYPDLEHMLNVVPTDVTGLTPEAAMYQYHRFRYGEGTRADLTDWLRTTV